MHRNGLILESILDRVLTNRRNLSPIPPHPLFSTPLTPLSLPPPRPPPPTPSFPDPSDVPYRDLVRARERGAGAGEGEKTSGGDGQSGAGGGDQGLALPRAQDRGDAHAQG